MSTLMQSTFLCTSDVHSQLYFSLENCEEEKKKKPLNIGFH